MDATFTGADNKTYHLSPLTLGDLREFTRWVQYLPYEQFQGLREQLPAEDFQAESRRLLQQCSGKKLNEGSPDVQAVFATLEGSLYLIYLSLRRNHPKISLADVGEIVTLPVAKEASEKLSVISGIADASKKNEAGSPLTLESSTEKGPS